MVLVPNGLTLIQLSNESNDNFQNKNDPQNFDSNSNFIDTKSMESIVQDPGIILQTSFSSISDTEVVQQCSVIDEIEEEIFHEKECENYAKHDDARKEGSCSEIESEIIILDNVHTELELDSNDAVLAANHIELNIDDNIDSYSSSSSSSYSYSDIDVEKDSTSVAPAVECSSLLVECSILPSQNHIIHTSISTTIPSVSICTLLPPIGISTSTSASFTSTEHTISSSSIHSQYEDCNDSHSKNCAFMSLDNKTNIADFKTNIADNGIKGHKNKNDSNHIDDEDDSHPHSYYKHIECNNQRNINITTPIKNENDLLEDNRVSILIST